MKAFSKTTKRSVMFVAALACAMVAGSVLAFAVPANQVARVMTGQKITAQCCVLIGPTVRVTEPATVTPVVVTWNGDYSLTGEYRLQLSVNGGPCLFYGSTVVPWLAINGGSGFLSSTFQWLVFPSDGLVKGVDTFTLCGGGAFQSETINIGFNTLAVQIGK